MSNKKKVLSKFTILCWAVRSPWASGWTLQGGQALRKHKRKILYFTDKERSAPIKWQRTRTSWVDKHRKNRQVPHHRKDCELRPSGQCNDAHQVRSERSCDPSVPLSRHVPSMHEDVCKGLIFTAALRSVGKHWKRPKCLLKVKE